MIIKILGTGCKRCKALEQNVREAISSAQVNATVEKVEDIPSIVRYGVMSTPALTIDEKVVSAGKVLSVDEVVGLLKK
ncbi:MULTISPECIES: thioredoxin family protein [Sporolactobacillus]|jgi:small redox-active disulfide protein 2|uniref:Redox-active disulfide protein 2 n=2 Tax=Sporolactobacillus TaxID=2077 RepID=A0A0U1QST6_9BACL|nr:MULTISPECIES: thioredoxin family protein [Sporolactobacillus]KLI03746.1 redox-active disulfide protein 2 [Sporolactobacillus inulinus CASD]MCL1632110.1 thioredoxin family protein [Sporolactobacillus mangiferae]RYL94263.1 thioredoxin family protein [Sporolactobacillus sp. THM7-4]GEB78118.1 redox-active disulfide protein 2 [Sporolactobacillus inulinus]